MICNILASKHIFLAILAFFVLVFILWKKPWYLTIGDVPDDSYDDYCINIFTGKYYRYYREYDGIGFRKRVNLSVVENQETPLPNKEKNEPQMKKSKSLFQIVFHYTSWGIGILLFYKISKILITYLPQIIEKYLQKLI